MTPVRHLPTFAIPSSEIGSASIRQSGFASPLTAATGAYLGGAQLQGAELVDAQLQGANFTDAALVATDVSTAEIWRANFFDAHVDKVFGDGLRETAMSKQDFVRLKDDITKSLPENNSRERVLKGIEVLNPDNTSAKAFGDPMLYAAKADKPAYQQALAGELKSLACSGEDSAESIVHGLVKKERRRNRAFRAAARRPDENKANLEEIVKAAAAKASAQVGETAPSIAHDERRDLQQSKNHKAKK